MNSPTMNTLVNVIWITLGMAAGAVFIIIVEVIKALLGSRTNGTPNSSPTTNSLNNADIHLNINSADITNMKEAEQRKTLLEVINRVQGKEPKDGQYL